MPRIYLYEGSEIFGFFLVISVLLLLAINLFKIPNTRFPQVALINGIIFYPLLYVGLIFSLGIPIQLHSPNNIQDLYVTVSRYFLFSVFWVIGTIFGSKKTIIKGSYIEKKNALNINIRIFSFAITLPIILELFINYFSSDGLQNSYVVGGDSYFEGASGISEYVASGLAILLVSLDKKRLFLIDYFALIAGVINTALGIKAAGSILIIFALLRITNFYINFNSYSKVKYYVVRILYLSSIFILTGIISLLNFLRCGASLACKAVALNISQASELFNTNMSISREVPFFGFGLEDPILYFKSLILLAIPTKITNLPAVYNPSLPYSRMIENGYHVGGGGSLDSHLISSFGNFLGLSIAFSLIFFLGYITTNIGSEIKLFSLRINSLFILNVICLLSVRFFYYDPVSVLVRTIPFGIIFYLLSNYILQLLPRKQI